MNENLIQEFSEDEVNIIRAKTVQESKQRHGSVEAANLAKYGDLVPLESELRKQGKPPILEYYKDAKTQEVTHVRLKDGFFALRPPQEHDDEIRGAFVSWEQISDVTVLDEETVDLLMDFFDRMNDGTPQQYDGPPGTKKSMINKVGCAILHWPMFRLNGQRDTSGEHIEGTWAPAVPEPIASIKELMDSPFTNERTREILKGILDTGRKGLSDLEHEQVAALEGMNDIYKKGNWTKVRSMQYKAMKYGALMLYDEPAVMPGNVRELLNPTLEWNPIFVAQGDTIRRLSKEETEHYEKTKELPKDVVMLNQYFRMSFADNPINIGNRTPRSDAIASRVEVSVVGKSKEKFFLSFIKFMVTGDEDDIVDADGTVYYGRKNVDVPYRNCKLKHQDSPIDSFEEMPNVKTFIRWWARFQMNLLQIIEDGNLGSSQDELGGNDTFTVRTFERGLDHVLKLISGARVEKASITKGDAPHVNANWYDAVYRMLEMTYMKSFPEDDRKKIFELIKASRLGDLLGNSSGKTNPSDPEWVANARVSGVNVQDNGATFTISFANLKKKEITLESLGLTEELLNVYKDETNQQYEVGGVWVLHTADFPSEEIKKQVIEQAQKEEYICVAVGDDIIMVPKVIGIRDVKSYKDELRKQEEERKRRMGESSNSEN